MNRSDIENGTRLVGLGMTHLRSQKTRLGGEVTIGVSSEVFEDLLNDKSFPVVIDGDEYDKRR